MSISKSKIPYLYDLGFFRGSSAVLLDVDFSSSIIPSRGSAVPTFVRATGQTFLDHEALLKTIEPGEVRFTGARRVRNLITQSERLEENQGSGSGEWFKEGHRPGQTLTYDQNGVPNASGTPTRAFNSEEFLARIPDKDDVGGRHTEVFQFIKPAGWGDWL